MLHYLPSLFLFGLIAGVLFLSSRYFGHLLSPFSVFYGIWFFALGLYHLRWVEYIPVRSYTWTLITVNLGMFGFGWLLAYLSCDLASARRRTEFSTRSVSAEHLRKVIFLFFLLGMIGLADFLWQVQRTIGLATYWESPQEIRWEMRLGGVLAERLQAFIWLNVANVVLGVFYLTILKGNRRRSIWTIVAVSAFATFLVTDRSRFFCAALWTGYLLAHARNWRTRQTLTAGLVIALILMLQFFGVGTWIGKVAVNNPELLGAATVEEGYFALLSPYTYLTGGFPALQAYIDSAPVGTAGAMTFHMVFKVMRVVDPTVKLPTYIPEPYSIPIEFNTFTWLHPFYSDFGFAGVMLGPWVVGLLAGLVYFRMRRSCSFNTLYVNGLICYGLTLSFIGNQLTQGPVWYFLAIGIPISRYVTRRAPVLAQG
jgi:oligosaccharide repeat unit polymerase